MAQARITEAQLKALVQEINELTGSPMVPYVDGKAQIGNYHLSYAYGGVCLHRMYNTGGGITTPLTSYHVPKRELYNEMRAFVRGLEAGSK